MLLVSMFSENWQRCIQFCIKIPTVFEIYFVVVKTLFLFGFFRFIWETLSFGFWVLLCCVMFFLYIFLWYNFGSISFFFFSVFFYCFLAIFYYEKPVFPSNVESFFTVKMYSTVYVVVVAPVVTDWSILI